MARLLTASLAGFALAAAAAAPAPADVFGPIGLASVGTIGGGGKQQVEYAHDPAMSADGRYVAFDGSVGGVTGVWRRSLLSGAIEQVAGGDAELPSLSAAGDVVSFTTNEGKSLAGETNGRPVVSPHPEAVNVYVRNMALAADEEGAFQVASAPTGTSEPLTYHGSSTTVGATAAGRTAISADGNEVAFVTTAVSDLVNPQTPAEPDTPAYQVAVRYLASQETRLVSTDRTTGGPVSNTETGTAVGGAYPGPSAPLPFFHAPPAYAEWGTQPPPGASISADGTTVAWMGADVGAQVQMLPAEVAAPLYTEPLWRRIAPGSETPTERVTGGSDPTAPGCPASGESALPAANQQSISDPCLGPFVVFQGFGTQSSGIWPIGENASGVGDFVPRLSADGYEVAFLSGALPKAAGANFGVGTNGEPADLYRADMHPGPSRDAATTTITELAGAEGVADTDPISEFAISPDGGQVAFTTRRTQFPLGSPAFVSAPAPEPGLSELYDADLADATVTRVTLGYEGGPSEQPHERKPEEDPYGSLRGAGAASPSFAGDSAQLAFASTASNLVFGDGNTPPAGPVDGSDVFLVQRLTQVNLTTPQTISPPPPTSTAPAWTIGVTARSRKDGSVLLYVTVPGAGSLRAGAQSTLLVSAGHSAGRASHAHRAAAGVARARRKLVSRAVSSAQRVLGGGGPEITTLALRLKRSYASLAARRGGLAATVTVAFTAHGHPTRRKTLEVAFVRKAQRSHKAHRSGAKGRRR